MACGCGKTTPRPTTTTASSAPAPIQPLGSEPELVGAGK